MTLPIIAYFAQSWQNIYVFITMPTCIYVTVWYLISDSPRWHFRKGNLKKTLDILLRATNANNNRRVSKIDLTDLHHRLEIDQHREKKKTLEKEGRLWENRRELVNFICLHIAWGCCTANFNGMLLNTRAFSPHHIHWNVFMTGNTLPSIPPQRLMSPLDQVSPKSSVSLWRSYSLWTLRASGSGSVS